MAYARIVAAEPRAFAAGGAAPKGARNWLLRLFDSLRESPAEREIAAYIAGRGNKWTDETEREIERILSSPGRF